MNSSDIKFEENKQLILLDEPKFNIIEKPEDIILNSNEIP